MNDSSRHRQCISNDNQLAVALRVYRGHRGITQGQLADRLGVKNNTLGDWESGRRRPQLRFHKPLADLLGYEDEAQVGHLFELKLSDDGKVVGPQSYSVGEIRLNISRRIASGPLSVEELELCNRLLDMLDGADRPTETPKER